MKDNFEFRMMFRRDTLDRLVKCSPRALHRLMCIITTAYKANFTDCEQFEQWFVNMVEKQEKRRLPTRTNMQVMMNLNHVKMILKSHYKFRNDIYKKSELKR